MDDDVDAGETQQGWDFFVSYTQNDRDWAEWIAWQIEDLGYTVLIQAWDFVAGSYWMAMMERGIRDAQHTVAVLSGTYLRSVYGEREWQAALQADPQGFRRRLVPVRVSDCARPRLLKDLISIDLVDRSESEAARHLRQQITVVVDGRAKPKAAPRFPLTSAITVRAGADESTDTTAAPVPAGPDGVTGPASEDTDPVLVSCPGSGETDAGAIADRAGPTSPPGLVRPARAPRSEPPAFPVAAGRSGNPTRVAMVGAATLLAGAVATDLGDDRNITIIPSPKISLTVLTGPTPVTPDLSGATPAASPSASSALPETPSPAPVPSPTTVPSTQATPETPPGPGRTTAGTETFLSATVTLDVHSGAAPLEVRADGGQSVAGSSPIREYAFSFDDVVKKGTEATSSHRFTEPGKHTITLTVTVTDEAGRQAKSRPESVHVESTARLSAPTLIMPMDNTPVFSGTSLDLMWNAVPGAADYTVEIERQTGESSWEHADTLRNQGATAVHTFTSPLERWQVITHGADGTTGLASEWRRVRLAPG
ncbi:hypothetical protein CC117_25435 [Parafrankia colletiae]|uniref:TIR domain-containing protein n=1 Tax=Parafrankia colletiae TaxID=573497 RepID=A0A1S1Q9Z6_9ACTN|nr:TIR domain-containing protein [Parafrankia colletiae]MCK9902137.1 TIR domain-containing protein [Frankia sp. Cpl3]OHV31678.1 hypothetical protein CC117_25435 [Parafrankia colletiae]